MAEESNPATQNAQDGAQANNGESAVNNTEQDKQGTTANTVQPQGQPQNNQQATQSGTDGQEIEKKILKKLGVDNLDTAAQNLKAYQDYQEKNKTATQKLQDQTAKLQKQLEESQRTQKALEAKNAALGKGVRADAVDDVIKLVGGADDVSKALDGVLKKYPQFGAQQQKSGNIGQAQYRSNGKGEQDPFVSALHLKKKK